LVSIFLLPFTSSFFFTDLFVSWAVPPFLRPRPLAEIRKSELTPLFTFVPLLSLDVKIPFSLPDLVVPFIGSKTLILPHLPHLFFPSVGLSSGLYVSFKFLIATALNDLHRLYSWFVSFPLGPFSSSLKFPYLTVSILCSFTISPFYFPHPLILRRVFSLRISFLPSPPRLMGCDQCSGPTKGLAEV